MKKMKYTNKTDDVIISHETDMLALYLEKLKKYAAPCRERGYSLKTGLMWQYFPKDTVTFQRGDFRNGYTCYVYCAIQKDGSEVRVNGTDGEAKYYPLSAAWMISSIFQKCLKLNVELYTNTDDADADMNALLQKIDHTRR